MDGMRDSSDNRVPRKLTAGSPFHAGRTAFRRPSFGIARGRRRAECPPSRTLPVLFFLTFFFAGPVFCEPPPTEVLQAARDGLPALLKSIPTGDEESFGFAAGEDRTAAAPGSPFRMHAILPERAAVWHAGQPVESMLLETSMWYFPVLLGGRARCMVIVDFIEKEKRWQAVSLGYSELARELSSLWKRRPTEGEMPPRIVRVFQTGEYFFTIPGRKEQNLTRLDLRGSERTFGKSGRTDYSTPGNAAETIGALRQRLAAMSQAKENGPVPPR